MDAWRERERVLLSHGVDVRLVSAREWNEGGTQVRLQPKPGEKVRGLATFGSHPALFVYEFRRLWRTLGEGWDLLDIHEEPYALATAQILFMRTLQQILPRFRTNPPSPYMLYSAQNIEKRYPWPFRTLERRALRHASALSVCNREAGRILRSKGMVGRIEIIPLGVDLEIFAPGPSPEERQAPPSRGQEARPPEGEATAGGVVVVGYAGRLAEHKGVDVLLRAALDDERLHLRIAGAGPLEHQLRSRTAGLGDRVRFLGALSGEELPSFYRSLDVLAVPSVPTPGWVEQFGRVAVEAMACGIPVVASDTGALPDVVGDAGLLVPAGDSRALGDALLTVADEPGLAEQLRAAGSARARACAWPEVARRYRELYEHCITGPQRPTSAFAASARERSGEALRPEVVLVAYGAPDMVRSALAPLVGHFPLTVVDNSSMPQIRSIAIDAGARYLDPGRNGGFAAGVNYALDRRDHPERDVLLLNPDAIISPDDVTLLQQALHADPALASTGPSQVDDDGVAATVTWPFPTPAGVWIQTIGLARLRRARPGRSFVIGSVLLLKAAAIAQVGRFDEHFFLYAEETDWAFRAHRQGWRHALVPAATALHLGGGTSSDPHRRDIHFHASQERYLRKHFGALNWQLARAGVLAGALLRSVLLRGAAAQSARWRLRTYAKGPVRAEASL
ncbi:glycosyltransferase [Pseudactinotalea sp. Z1748]|uniref:glycosyltransferase n=1 Tax=Pseudactinotalea sp. Z1748 TaxID=3413027 RepID=UPI003C7AAD8C